MANMIQTPEEVYLKKLFTDIKELMELHVRRTLEFYHYRGLTVNRSCQQNVNQNQQERRPQMQMMMSPSPPNAVSPQFPENAKQPLEQKPLHSEPTDAPQQPDGQFPSFYKQASGEMGVQPGEQRPQFVSRPVTRQLPGNMGQYSYSQMGQPQNAAGRESSSPYPPTPLEQQAITPQQLPMIMRNIQRNPEMIPHTYGQPGIPDSKVASIMSHPAAYHQLYRQQSKSYAPSSPTSLFDGMVDWALYLKDLPQSEKKDDFWHINTEGVDATLDDLIAMMDTSSPLPKNFVFPPMGQTQMMQAPGII